MVALALGWAISSGTPRWTGVPLAGGFLAAVGQLGTGWPGFSGSLRTVLAPLVVVFAATPLIVLGVLLVVAAFMTPAITAGRPSGAFPRWSSAWRLLHGSALWSLGSTLLALIAAGGVDAAVGIPPLILVLPP
jgi:hypothetical protein